MSNAVEKLAKLEVEIATRLFHDEDTGEITRSLGATAEQVGRIKDALPDCMGE